MSAVNVPRALHEMVADRIRSAILDGEFEPGMRLVEDRLAQTYEVSRHPVREALRTLQLEGLVEISPRRGATVSRVSPEEVVELLEVLAALDGLSARLAAAANSTSTEIARLLDRAVVAVGMPSGNDQSDRERSARFNRDFHTRVAEAGGNQQLIETITPLRDRIQWHLAAAAQRNPEHSWAEHQQIYDAIRDGDGDRAESLARAHTEAARDIYLAYTSPTGAP